MEQNLGRGKLLPNTFIVGAAKSGTTALANFLNCSDEVYLPDEKEPHYHIPKKVKKEIPSSCESLDSYSLLYKNSDEVIKLDASVLYLPLHSYSINSIKSLHGDDVRIIIILREPLERAISAYEHSKRFNAKEKFDFTKALELEPERRDGNPMLCYYWLSDYSEQVMAFQKSFRKVKVISSESLQKNPQAVIDDLCSFLSIGRFDIKPNVESNKGFSWKNERLGLFLNRVFPGKLRHKIKKKLPFVYNLLNQLVKFNQVKSNKGNIPDLTLEQVRSFEVLKKNYMRIIQESKL